MLCEICKSVDFGPLVLACLQRCRDRQEAYYGDGHGWLAGPDDSSWVKQHDDIFELQKRARDCGLCRVIFQAFEQRKVANREDARGLPIGFRLSGNNIEVCYNSEEGLIRLCGLVLYMNETHGMSLVKCMHTRLTIPSTVDSCFRICEIKEDDSPPILKIMEKDPGSGASFAIASGWLRNA
jgi:hypothetical protein